MYFQQWNVKKSYSFKYKFELGYLFFFSVKGNIELLN